ncbi:hypothetical protein M3196_15120 [Fictibacillus nanhaiensis]|uniref:hypothetical protein n=1 Tax=Fictibacillus nanhaiensis TaxID=742169 RepID=UPI00203B9E67|nr:hypothetical protein [Fictibacillus nanhaiensis]MCM3732984.1 hypothetical protein [Fictibacillus nanhaiensis]
MVTNNTFETGLGIITVNRTVFNNFDDVRKIANFTVKIPKKVPNGYSLKQIEYYKPNTSAPKKAKNDMLLATYSDGKNEFEVHQGYFGGEYVPKGPKGTLEGEVSIQNEKGNWTKGTIKYTGGDSLEDVKHAKKEWEEKLLQLGWRKEGIGYRITTEALNLEELTIISESLEE